MACVWLVDNEYDAFEVDTTHWLNTAVELAQVGALVALRGL